MRKLVGPQRRVQEVGIKQGGIYRARLAEAYDGIGQYVSVALAGSSVGSALRARIASGDFGGRRTFPRGTPVTVVSNRGNLEVFLGNIPDECLTDHFDAEVPGASGTTYDSWSWPAGILGPPYSGGIGSGASSGMTDSRAWLKAGIVVGQGYQQSDKDGRLLANPLFQPGIEASARFEKNIGLDVGGSNGTGGSSGFRLDVYQFESVPGQLQAGVLVQIRTSGTSAAGTLAFKAFVSVDIYDSDFNVVESFSTSFTYPSEWLTNGLVFDTKIYFDTEVVRVKTWLTTDSEPADWDLQFSGWTPSYLAEALNAPGYFVDFGISASEGNTTYLDWIRYCDNVAAS